MTMQDGVVPEQISGQTEAGAPVSARRQETQRRLMDAASHVFAEKGIEGASVEEISESAGFTRGAFYSNFESKDNLCFALLRTVFNRFLDSVRHTVDHIIPADGSTMDRNDLIDTAVDTFLAAQPQERHLVLLLMEMQLYALRHPGFGAAHSRLIVESTRMFAEVFETALGSQGLELALPTEQVVDILKSVHHGGQVSALAAPETPTQIADQLKTVLGALIR